MEDLISSTAVAAQPGYYLVWTCEGEDRTSIPIEHLSPVLAWRIDTYKSVNDRIFSVTYPVSLEGDEDSNDYGVVRPNGTVEAVSGEIFASVDEWLQAAIKKYSVKAPACGPWVQSDAPEAAGALPDDETAQGGIWRPGV